MQNYDTPTIIEKLQSQIKEEQRRYRNALCGDAGFSECNLIKNNIKKLEASLQQILHNLHEYIPYSASTM